MNYFTIIDAEMYAVPDNGYKLHPAAARINQYAEIWDREQLGEAEYWKRVARANDSFYDLDGAYLCQDQTADWYAVLYLYSHIHGKFMPAVWQRVIKERDAE
jgi:hypothetical protein